jgi:hypothetical protein
LFCQRACFSFKVQVCFAWTVFSDDFIEAASLGDLQKIGDKFFNVTEGAKPFSNSPFFTILPGPVICRDVECSGGEVVSKLKHGLLRHHSIYSYFPEWEGCFA